ncbi:DUF4214 domain-containing protein [Pigmentiphaga aceris]|nr:DUF4214 domain-containing protein [Pigmentiphaga aceris]
MSARVQQAYFTLFGRPADPAGLAFWDNVSASLSDAQLYEALAASPEFQASADITTTSLLTSIYQNAFGRAPDADGLNFWLSVITADGGDLAAVARAAASIISLPTPESADGQAVVNKTQVSIALTEALSNTDHANSIDATTLASAKALLAQTGSTALPEAAALATAITGVAQTVATDTLSKVHSSVQTLYVAVYGRPADPDGLNFWTATLDSLGGDASALATQFISADNAEFVATYGALSADEFLATLYQNLTGRAPDADGASFWKGSIENLTNAGESTLAGFAAVAAQVVQAVVANPTSADANVAKNTAAVAQSFTEQLVQQAGPDADLSQISAAALTAARELLNGVTADPASVTQAQEKVTDLAKGVLEQVGVPVVNPPLVTPPVVSPPATLAFTVDAALENDNPATGAFKTIQAAIDAVGDGRAAVIKVAAGIYTEDLVLKSSITLEGQGDVKVVSAGSDTAVLAEHASNITIKNMVFEENDAVTYQLAFKDASGITLDHVTLIGDERDAATGLYLNGVAGATLSQVTVRAYGKDGIAVVAKDAAPDWKVSKDLTFTDVSATNNGTGLAFYTKGTGIFANPEDAEADINGVVFKGATLISGNGTGVLFGEEGGLKAVHGEFVTPEFGTPSWASIELQNTMVNGNTVQVLSHDRTFPAYIIAAGTDDITVNFDTRVELEGDVPQLVTFTEEAGYSFTIGGSSNIELQRDKSTFWLSDNSDRTTPYQIDVKSSGSEISFSAISYGVTQDIQLTLDANALKTLELSGIYTTARFVLTDTSQLSQLTNIKLTFLTTADILLNLKDAQQSIVLDSSYEGLTSTSSQVDYTGSQHGDTLNIAGRYGSVYTLGSGDDVVSYLGSLQYTYGDPTQLPISSVSTAGVSRVGTREVFGEGVVNAYDTIKNFGASDVIRIETAAERGTFGNVTFGTDNVDLAFAQVAITTQFAQGKNVVFATLPTPDQGYLFVDLDGNGAYEAAKDFAIKIELAGGVTFTQANLELFASEPTPP